MPNIVNNTHISEYHRIHRRSSCGVIQFIGIYFILFEVCDFIVRVRGKSCWTYILMIPQRRNGALCELCQADNFQLVLSIWAGIFIYIAVCGLGLYIRLLFDLRGVFFKFKSPLNI